MFLHWLITEKESALREGVFCIVHSFYYRFFFNEYYSSIIEFDLMFQIAYLYLSIREISFVNQFPAKRIYTTLMIKRLIPIRDSSISDRESHISDGEMRIFNGELHISDGELDIFNGELLISDGELRIFNGELLISDGELHISKRKT